MLARFLTKVLGSRHDEHAEAQRRASRLEARLDELRLESLAGRRVPSRELALPIPGTIDSVGTLADEQVLFGVDVPADVPGGAASDSETLSLGTASAGDEFTTATLIGTETPSAGSDARYSFVATGLLAGADAISSPGDASITFAGTSPSSGATATVTLIDGSTTTREGPTHAIGLATFTISNLEAGVHSTTARYVGDASFTLATSQDLGEITLPTVAISVTGTLLNRHDTFTLSVHARVADGAPSDSAALLFIDSEAGDPFTAATVASVQIDQAETSAPDGAPMGLCTCFAIAGILTQSGGTSARYGFVVTVALPITGVMDSTAFLTLQVSGPSEV